MPTVRYTGGGRYALRDGPTWTDGDEHAVDPDTADRLADRHDFELVETVEADGDTTDEDDTSEWAVALAEEHWQTVCSEVRAGEVDDLLDDLAEIDNRDSVQAAIADRRAELE